MTEFLALFPIVILDHITASFIIYTVIDGLLGRLIEGAQAVVLRCPVFLLVLHQALPVLRVLPITAQKLIHPRPAFLVEAELVLGPDSPGRMVRGHATVQLFLAPSLNNVPFMPQRILDVLTQYLVEVVRVDTTARELTLIVGIAAAAGPGTRTLRQPALVLLAARIDRTLTSVDGFLTL